MSKFNKDKVMPRYMALAVVLTLIGFAVIGKAAYIMTVKKSYWSVVANQQKNDSDSIRPNRGNILSCDGQLLASSIPEYRVFIDFCAGDPKDTAWTNKREALWNEKLDSICMGLHQLFPSKTEEEHKQHLVEGHDAKKRHWPVVKGNITYNEFMEIKALPYLSLPKNKGGFHYEKQEARRRPFGNMAVRTIGDVYGGKDSARCGIELSFDSILRGKKGLKYTEKVRNKFVDRVLVPAQDGADIITTLDVGIQDIAENAVVRELKEIEADLGLAIVMEVETGDVKAIVNMTRMPDGSYKEVQNNALSYMREPGSVFKTASIMVALDDGVCDTFKTVDTGKGVWKMYGSWMRDHNAHRGGYGMMTLPKTLEFSSNIGVSRIIDEYYSKQPEKFVEGLRRIGIATDLQLPFAEYKAPNIRMPERNEKGRIIGRWYKTTLPWMSIGYETQVPPISTVTFYNAIANNGRMMRPRFVKALQKDGKIIKEYPPEVIKEQIAKPSTIATMQTILEHVVSQGLGKPAWPRTFPVSGKTGTAQIADESGGYHSGVKRYWLSFVGYFPSNAPRYSCIVCIQKNRSGSGGGMSGVVFREIAEKVMAKSLKMHVEDARNPQASLTPEVKNGDVQAANVVLNQFNVKTVSDWSGNSIDGTAVWGNATHNNSEVTLTRVEQDNYVMPNVYGMGARDAVFLLEKRGVKAVLKGRGSVKSQSIPAGTSLEGGMVCELILG